MGTMAFQITNLTIVPLFTQLFLRVQNKENIEAPRHWSFVQGIHR